MNVRRQIFIGLGAAVFLAVLLGVVKFFQISQAIAEAKRRVQPAEAVTTFVVVEETWPQLITAVGSVFAKSGAMLSAESAGRVSKINFKSGNSVQVGDVLVALDSSVEEAKLKGAVARRELAKLAYLRSRELRDRNANSISDYEKAENSLKDAEAEVEERQAEINRRQIVAPFAGIVGVPQVDVGEFLSVGTPVISVNDLENVEVRFSVPQQDIDKLRLGLDVEIKTDSANLVVGKLSAISPDIDPVTRSFEIRAELKNPKRVLLPGMFVRANIVQKKKSRVLSVPASSVIYAPYGDSVFVVEDFDKTQGGEASKKKVRQQIVTLGKRVGEKIEIIKGIKVGDEVVSSGSFKLRPGAEITVDNSTTPGNSATPTPEDS